MPFLCHFLVLQHSVCFLANPVWFSDLDLFEEMPVVSLGVFEQSVPCRWGVDEIMKVRRVDRLVQPPRTETAKNESVASALGSPCLHIPVAS